MFRSNAGYCFVDFTSTEAAANAIQRNGQPIPNSSRPFKLNWASGGGLADRRFDSPNTDRNVIYNEAESDTFHSRDDRGPEFSIFVGDLAPDVGEFALMAHFQGRYPSCKSAKIMTDPISGQSRGYGFVRFSDESEQQRALTEMQGVFCGSRPMRISTATPKNKSGGGGGGGHGGMGGPGPMGMHGGGGPMGMYGMGAPPMGQVNQGGYYGGPQPMNQFTDPNNTTVFVGGLSGYVTEDELRSFFQGFGEITYVKIPPGKGCGFVQFVLRHAAEMAINQMQGYPIGNSRVRLSWGRSQNNSGPAGTPYRPAPPPPVYPNMGMGPAPYGQFQMKVCVYSLHPCTLLDRQLTQRNSEQSRPFRNHAFDDCDEPCISRCIYCFLFLLYSPKKEREGESGEIMKPRLLMFFAERKMVSWKSGSKYGKPNFSLIMIKGERAPRGNKQRWSKGARRGRRRRHLQICFAPNEAISPSL